MHHNELTERNTKQYGQVSSQNINSAERIASAVSGWALIAYGMESRKSS